MDKDLIQAKNLLLDKVCKHCNYIMYQVQDYKEFCFFKRTQKEDGFILDPYTESCYKFVKFVQKRVK
jgi:hypothetical protein